MSRDPQSPGRKPTADQPAAGNSKPSEYDVGYGKPPVHSQFKQGGRPGPGRPKGAKNRATLFNEALNTPRPVTIDGKKRKMTAQALGYYQLAQKTAKGDLRAIELVEKIHASLIGSDNQGEVIEPPLSEAELAILRRRSHE